ncbi:MAG: extracellular solute-binding protein [Myxococcota bacterium]|nr:extracellular solute-binding protein [Myxococcota bacterium]
MTNSSRRDRTRRGLGLLLCMVAMAFAALGCKNSGSTTAGESSSAATTKKAPVTINVVDVAGSLALLQTAMERYRDKHPDTVEKINFTKAPAPELPAKLKAMQAAGRSDIDLVTTGTDALAAGIDQGLWTRILPDHADVFPGLTDSYLPQAREMQKLAQDQALAVVFMPAGPLVEYNPAKVEKPPTTPAELLAWAKAHPKRFIYARPRNSGPGRTFLMGLPYLLGDANPKDPINGWTKTWAFLKDLGTHIEYYPSGTGATMKEFGEGSRDMTVTVTGWDLNPRALGIVPKAYKVAAFQNMTWVNDTQYLAVPKGLTADKLAVVLDLMKFLLQPEQQALTYDKGYFYPGPAIKNVPITMAPQESQDVIRDVGRPEYEGWLAQFPHVQPLESKLMVAAFDRWDQDIGGQKLK